jgi:RNA polymerase sigma-32 factor
LIEVPRTLESLGIELELSKERIRQIEAAAFKKMRTNLETEAPEAQDFFH